MKIALYFVLVITFLISTFLITLFSLFPNMETAEPVTDVFFPKRPVQPVGKGYFVMEAAISGKLEIKDNCLGFKRSDGFETFIGWIPNYDLMKKDNEIHIVENGMSIATVGDFLRLGGGQGPKKGVTLSSNGVQCPPPYWTTGALPRPSFMNRLAKELRSMEWM